jgi:DNA (cytosine-5)-methyltransferase 1
MDKMVHSSFFTGIGGFDLAALWMEWINLFQCEIDPYCLQLLNKHFPNTKKHADIRETDFTVYRGLVDVLSGGFPCQPYSTAGERRGNQDSRHLWPENLRGIREIQPGYVLGENVRGLTNWNAGLVFNQVQADLEAEGYEVTPFLLPAAGVGAPHERYRIFFVAYSHLYNDRNKDRRRRAEAERIQEINRTEYQPSGELGRANIKNEERGATSNPQSIREREPANQTYPQSDGRAPGAIFGSGSECIITNTNSNERSERGMYTEGIQTTGGHPGTFDARTFRQTWENFPIEPPLCRGNDGISSRMDRIAANKHRTERLKGLGNAVVPQLAYQIFKAIQEFDDQLIF